MNEPLHRSPEFSAATAHAAKLSDRSIRTISGRTISGRTISGTDEPATKVRILDAAEKLFGLKGFAATSLRDITAEAKVNLAAVNYHFRSKDILTDAVIERRIQPVNQRRLEMLDAAGPNPSVEQIVEAYLAPLLILKIHKGIALMGRALSHPDQFFERIYKPHLAAIAERFGTALGKALPSLPAKERFWRMQFMAGSMAHLMVLSGALPRMCGSPDTPLDQAALMDRLVEFLSAGLRAPCGASRHPRTKSARNSNSPKPKKRKVNAKV